MVRFALYFSRDKRGATAIEYGLLAALVAVVIIGAVAFTGASVAHTFDTIVTAM